MSLDPDKKIKLLFACLDWRLHPQIEEFFVKNGDGCDTCVTAGSVKGLIEASTRDYLLDQISTSIKLHHCQAVILTMHMDCGAYGGSSAFGDETRESEHHAKILADARSVVISKFPEMKIKQYIIGLQKSGGSWVIKPQPISN